MSFTKITANLSQVETSIQYGLIKIQNFVDDQLQSTGQELQEMLEFLVIKRVIKSVREGAELDDYVGFLDSVLDFLDNEYKEIVDFEEEQLRNQGK
jgi:hypothetical protein